MSHDETRKFDAEDARLVESLATVASNAYQVLTSLRVSRTADQLKDDFLAQLSHEMRTPLQTAILGLRALTMEDPPSRGVVKKRAAPAIERSLKSLTRMVDEIFDVSKIREGRLSIDLGEADLGEIVKDAVDACRETAAGAKVDVALDLDGASSFPVRVDVTRIGQVVANLLSNSVKFTPAGGSVSVRVREAEGHQEIEVQDTGEGINPEVLPMIFEKFVQGDSSISKRHGGLGIGLALS